MTHFIKSQTEEILLYLISEALATHPHFPAGSHLIRHHKIVPGVIRPKIGWRFARAFPPPKGGSRDCMSILSRADIALPPFRPLRGVDGKSFGSIRLAKNYWGTWLFSHCPITVDPRRALAEIALATGCYHYATGSQWPDVWKPDYSTSCLFWVDANSPQPKSLARARSERSTSGRRQAAEDGSAAIGVTRES